MFEFADILPSVVSMIIFLMMAMTVIPAAKYFFARFHVPGMSELAGAM